MRRECHLRFESYIEDLIASDNLLSKLYDVALEKSLPKDECEKQHSVTDLEADCTFRP